MDARGRVLSPRQALELQLRTVSDQLAESLAGLAGMDGQYPAAELPAGADPAAALLERVRELEEQTQFALQQHMAPGKAVAPTPPSPHGSNPETAEKRPAWGSPLGSASPRREQFAAARSRSAATSPRRSSARSPGGSRSSTPTGRPPTPGKKRAERERESRAARALPGAPASTPPAEVETLSAWGNTDDADTLTQQAQSLSQTSFKERPGSPAEAGGEQTANAEQLNSKLPQAQRATATSASDRNPLEQRVAEPEKELTRTKAKLSRGKRTGSPGKRGRSPLPRRTSSPLGKTTSPEEQTRAGRQATSPARSSSPGRGTEVILSRGSREEKERLLAQVAALQQGIADAEQRELPQSILLPCAFATRCSCACNECVICRNQRGNPGSAGSGGQDT